MSTVTKVSFGTDYAQAFTTGSSAGGYKLTRLEIRMEATSATPPTYTVKIHADSSTCSPTTLTSCPGSEVGTLTNPSSPPGTAGLVAYNAPTGGIQLDPNTTYWLVRDVTAGISAFWNWFEDASDDEDDSPAAGWSIANGSIWRTFADTSWSSDTTTLIFAIYGHELRSFVSNDEVFGSTQEADFALDRAQDFTTGSGTGGYTLTHLALRLESSAGTAPTYSVKIQGDSSSLPDGTDLGTLTSSATLSSSFALVEFAASGSGISLSADTTYWVVLDVSTGGSDSNVAIKVNNAEDPGGLPGWSIGNNSYFRNQDDSTAWQTAT